MIEHRIERKTTAEQRDALGGLDSRFGQWQVIRSAPVIPTVLPYNFRTLLVASELFMMTRAILPTAALLFLPTLLSAQQPHDWSYLEGSWRFESSIGYKAKIEYEIVAGGAAAIGRWSDMDGGESVETIGWHPDNKSMVSIGFGTGGKYWRREYTQVSKEKCHGAAVFIDPNGTTINGTSTLTRVNPDLVTGEMVGKTQDGKQVKMSVKFFRAGSVTSDE